LLTKAASRMRKDKEQQKKAQVRQLELFSKTDEPAKQVIGGIDRTVLTGVELLSRLENQRALTKNLMEEIVDYANLKRAYKQLSNNGGSSGVDGMEIEELRKWFGEHLNKLREELLTERYEVSAVRKVEISKPTGGTRTLGIPTVKDRFIQQAIHQQLSRWYESQFSSHSYGFRAGRGAHQAILRASEYIKEGKEWVVDIDLENFFDRINHDRLMQRLSKGIGDKRVLRLINAYLKAGMMEGGLAEQRISGTPQGGSLALRTHLQTLSFQGYCKLNVANFSTIIKSSIFVTNGKSTELRTGQTYQWDICLTSKRKATAANCRAADGQVWCVTDTGLSLYPAGQGNQRKNGGSGEFRSLYSEAATDADTKDKKTLEIKEAIDQQSGTYRVGGVFSKEGSCPKRRSKLRYHLPMTGCGSKNSLRYIISLFQPMPFSPNSLQMN